MKTIYKTKDDKEFDTKKEALKHEITLKKQPICVCKPWLDPDTFELYNRMPGSHIDGKCSVE